MIGRRFYVDLMQDPAEVTGSFILVVVKIDDKTIKFVIDCGMFQENGYEDRNKTFPTNPSDIDFMVLTHNHVDHNGRIPYFVKQGFDGKIYMSSVTSRIVGRAFGDNAKVIGDTSKRRNEKPLYSSDDIPATLELIEAHDWNSPIRVNKNITLTLVPNGHLIGAASIYVQIHCTGEKDINLFFTGDFNDNNMFFDVPPVRKWITSSAVTVVTESTYGDMDSTDVVPVFENNISKAVGNGKTIVIPVFSLGRAQEILYCLKKMQEKYKELFRDVPIFYDGKLSFYYTDVYLDLIKEETAKFYKDTIDFLPSNLVRIDNKGLRREAIATPGCKIIVTTSGMGNYGPAQTYIPKFIKDPNALIHFTGYCAEGTLGYNLKYTPKGEIVEVGGVKVIKAADVEFTSEFSAHAKADQLIAHLKKFEKPQLILVNHGRDDKKDIFANRILKEIEQVENVGILGREHFYRIDSDGFVKTFTSKFL